MQNFKANLPKNKAIIGIDFGTKRIGIAVSDLSCTIANSYKILYRTNLKEDINELKKIICEKEVGGIVMGLPLLMNGQDSEITSEVRKFAEKLKEKLNIPILLWDERLSSTAVEKFLINEVDMSRKKRSKILDASAACYILQGALDALKYQK